MESNAKLVIISCNQPESPPCYVTNLPIMCLYMENPGVKAKPRLTISSPICPAAILCPLP
ncbi:hypothetical protein BDV93DRAFT_78542 [Ceratobasidium sp. AG-I]|nr:hypothetical protein BDV93DRAFT_78542 [Ceratobasidium sp. AG-I]